MAKDLQFNGIEVRGLGDDIFAVKARPFTDSQLPLTVKKLKELGLEIPCLASGCALKLKENHNQNIVEITQYIVLAQKLGTPYVRVLADLHPEAEARSTTTTSPTCSTCRRHRRGLRRHAARRDERRLRRHEAAQKAA